MKMIQRLCLCTLALTMALTISSGNLMAEEIRVAVASNFTDTIRLVAKRFEAKTNHKINLIFGSTGKHYAQIKNGAPFEAFFAADARRPELLEQDGLIIPGSRFTYAVGKVILWSPEANFVDTSGNILKHGNFRHLSIANPKLAPYGRAAQQVLEKLGVWNDLQRRMVRGENIGQAFQFVNSGNARLGFVAFSQIKSPDKSIKGSFWQVPESFYDPIEQQAVLLKNNNTARAFMDFVKQDEALEIIHGFGYGTP